MKALTIQSEIDAEVARAMAAIRSVGRDPRSGTYWLGCEAAIENGFAARQKFLCPYSMGDAYADAWLAGYEEGRVRYKKFRAEGVW